MVWAKTPGDSGTGADGGVFGPWAEAPAGTWSGLGGDAWPCISSTSAGDGNWAEAPNVVGTLVTTLVGTLVTTLVGVGIIVGTLVGGSLVAAGAPPVDEALELWAEAPAARRSAILRCNLARMTALASIALQRKEGGSTGEVSSVWASSCSRICICVENVKYIYIYIYMYPYDAGLGFLLHMCNRF
ncbi:MAG: hypothetical protein GY772_01840 [bacterium]|nr:hypothetical protein [bacterium]